MNGNNKTVVDFPDGQLFVGPEDDLCIKKPIKRIRLKEALEYARQKHAEGRDVTLEEMQQFVD